MIGRLVLVLVLLGSASAARADIPPIPRPAPPPQPAMPLLGIESPSAARLAVAGVMLALAVITAGLAVARRRPQGRSPAPLKLAGIALFALAGGLAAWAAWASAEHRARRPVQLQEYRKQLGDWQPNGPWEGHAAPDEPRPARAPEGAPAP